MSGSAGKTLIRKPKKMLSASKSMKSILKSTGYVICRLSFGSWVLVKHNIGMHAIHAMCASCCCSLSKHVHMLLNGPSVLAVLCTCIDAAEPQSLLLFMSKVVPVLMQTLRTACCSVLKKWMLSRQQCSWQWSTELRSWSKSSIL